MDPLAESMPNWSTYNYTFNNPIKFTDPDGRSPDGEFEKDEYGAWQKVSEVGDDIGIDFYHLDDEDTNGNGQITLIRDRITGSTNSMTNGRKWLKGGVIRDESVNWYQLYTEWRWGEGPETSIFSGDHPNNVLIQESDWLQEEIQNFINSGRSRDMKPYNWDSGIRSTLRGDTRNMQLAYMGSYNVSFYKLGLNTLVFIIDDKTRESGMGHLPLENYSREDRMPIPFPWSERRTRQMTTTFQRYLFVISQPIRP